MIIGLCGLFKGAKDETNVGFSSISEYFLECFLLICSSSSYRSCIVVLLSFYDVIDKKGTLVAYNYYHRKVNFVHIRWIKIRYRYSSDTVLIKRKSLPGNIKCIFNLLLTNLTLTLK